MAIPDYQSLMLPVLSAASKNEVRISDIVLSLANELGLTAEERAQLLPSGRQSLFANRVQWAKTYLSKAGLVEITRRGHFQITDRGRSALQSNPARIDNKFLSQFEDFQKFVVRGAQEEGEDAFPSVTASIESRTKTPDEVMRDMHREIDTSLAQDLIDRVRSAQPDFFEKLIVNLLLSMGFGGSVADAGRALGRSGDNGVDGVIDQDALGLDRIYIQAKRFAEGNSVGSGAIRDFFGSLDRHKASKGLFVTTSYFSPSAVETAKYLSKRIVLIDGIQLAKLMIRHNVGCRVEETLEIKKIDEDYFE
ncbi:MAG: restriction endonuclease [Rhodopseudomonas sp.]|uniref:restriction endonuclease n=1 Tax=Rhodopseudomonas sp. TaxID=1078 RepID=UPI0039E4CC53